MRRDYWLQVRTSKVEMQVLRKLAETEHLKISECVRQLIRQAAAQAGLWPPPNIDKEMYVRRQLT